MKSHRIPDGAGQVHPDLRIALPWHGRPEELAREKLALFDDYEQCGSVWFWSTDTQGRLTYLSEAAAQCIGKEAGDLFGKSLDFLFDINDGFADRPGERLSCRRKLKLLLRAKTPFENREARATIADREVWWSVSGRPQFNLTGEFTGYRGSAFDITTKRSERRNTSRLALFDTLTGLANRRKLTDRLKSILTSQERGHRHCALMMLDLDRFKHINDTLGHPAGDALLQQVAHRLGRIVGKTGEIGRTGGDEFQVILPDLDDRGDLGALASRIIHLISRPYRIDGNNCNIGVSVGIAVAPHDGSDADELVRNADLSLYAAKEGGRGQFRFYSSDLHSRAEERRQIEGELRKAIPRGELELHYQPLSCPFENHVQGFEALLRWRHPERGTISPDLFISVAEETGLIVPLGEWALRRACRDASQWPADIRVAVNVSPLQFVSDGLADVVASAIRESGLAPHRLELEITESVFLVENMATRRTFARLNELGVRLVLDDFGTGYSSLGYLQDAPFDKIKIDQSFIRGAVNGQRRGNAAIVAAIVGLAKSLGMETTAEGIEARDELAFVRDRGVTTVQGYIYGPAIPQSKLLSMVENDRIAIAPNGPARTRFDPPETNRKISLIRGNRRYDVALRNLSQTRARVEGLAGVDVGTRFNVDFGGGQRVMASIVRSDDRWQELDFETPLTSDGGDGWCTRHRVAPRRATRVGHGRRSLSSEGEARDEWTEPLHPGPARLSR